MSVLVNQSVDNTNMVFPFSSINNVDLNNLQCSDTISFLNALPNLEIVAEVSKFSNSEVDLNMAFQTDCKIIQLVNIKNLRTKSTLIYSILTLTA